jgi:hypothetical protein
VRLHASGMPPLHVMQTQVNGWPAMLAALALGFGLGGLLLRSGRRDYPLAHQPSASPADA